MGDEAGLFGHGTSGEGNDVTDLTLPGVQQELLHALADTGTPVVAVLVTGRPYALGDVAGRLAAVVQAFFPGEEGSRAIAGVLTGRVTPSGKLPVEVPRVRNTGPVAGIEVVQLYLSDPLASVVRPVRWLAGFTRVALASGESARVTFRLHADRTAFTGRDGTRMVEPGVISVAVGGASDDLPLTGSFTLTGPVRAAGAGRVLTTPVSVRLAAGENG